MSNLFDRIIDKSPMYTLKWDEELEVSNDPTLLPFGTADMDFLSPQPILDAIHRIADIGHLGYPKIRSTYYATIIAWLKRLGNWDIQKEWIIPHVGVYTSCWTVIDALTVPDDEIIMQTPCHMIFKSLTQDNGRIQVVNPLIENNGRYEMDFERLEACFTEKTKLFWLCNPHNPVGRVWSKEELSRLMEICLRHNVVVMSDDVYCGHVYSGYHYTPIASISKEAAMNTIICYSTSKAYNTTGSKHSFTVIENSELRALYSNSVKKLNLHYGKDVIGLAICEAALNECDSWLRELMAYIEGNYRAMQEFVQKEMPQIRVIRSESSYLAWLDFRALNLSTDEEFLNFFVKNAHVLVEPGYKFGDAGRGFIRFNMGCRRALMLEGLERIKRAINGTY